MTRRPALPLLLAGLMACVPARPTGAQELARADAALRAGRYAEAIAQYGAAAGASDSAARGLLRALLAVGRYDDAEAAARRFEAAHPGSAAVATRLGQALRARGRLAAAESAFTRGAAAADSLTARLELAELRLRRGERDRAFAALERLAGAGNRGERLSSEDLLAVGTASRHLGLRDPDRYRDALSAYDAALERDSLSVEARLLAGELFLEKYNAADARRELAEALRRNPSHPRALLGMARRARAESEPGADSLVRRALAVNPRLVPALVFLASLRLEANDPPGAVREAERALAVDPASMEALAVLAAVHRLRGDRDGFTALERRAAALDPGSAELHVAAAELSGRLRRYGEAVELARAAVTRDSTSWRAWSVLGTNQLRTGAMDEGRRSLEIAFRGDPYNVWVKNTLDLLDRLVEFPVTASPRFRFVIHPDDSELLTLYLAGLAEAAWDSLAARYRYRPPRPIRLEVFPAHADFSVRTVGLAGLGALGVSFGDVLAMDAPSARERGSFNWGSTAWHEIGHAFTLGATGQRVPRWFSEGVSVHEERRARHGWGMQAGPDFIAALREGRLLPVADLDDGFVRPSYPGQVAVSYYQASLVVELIEREGGVEALRTMLARYAGGASDEDAVGAALGIGPDELDRRLDRMLRERFGPVLAGGLERLVEETERGRRLARDGRTAEAIAAFERARAAYPEFPGADGPLWHLGVLHVSAGDTVRAVAALRELTRLNDSHYEANLRLADLLEARGDLAGAADALERTIWISPYDPAVHDRLAALAARLGRHDVAVRERRAVLALEPVDRPAAWYRLARAQRDAGDRTGARRSVLRALEMAPSFAEAQELLLDLREATP